MTIYLALIVCLIGLVIWGLCVVGSAVGSFKAWVAEVAKHTYWVSLLAFLMTAGAQLATCSGSVHSH